MKIRILIMKAKNNFTYTTDNEAYVVQLKKKNLWWLLLFLLPFLLLLLQIRLHKQVIFKTIDQSSQIVIPNATVEFSYPDRNFIDFKTFKFFTNQEINRVDTTNNQGLVKFDVSYTLYSKLFHSKDKATVVATGGCFQSDTIHPFFYELKDQKENIIELTTRKKTIVFTVIDNFDGQVLPDADVTVDYFVAGQKQTFTAKSDARGIVEAEITYCADSLRVTAEKFGYKSYQTHGTPEHFNIEERRKLPLEPITTPVNFTVKDLYTKNPVPNATARLVFEASTLQATTNTNGIGKAMFDSIAINKQMHIEVSHPAYYDTSTQIYTVDEFMKLSEEQRTIYIRPKPGNITFQNIDKFTKSPVEGVKNEVYVNGEKRGEYFSNTNGEFVVPNLSPNDKITIKASKPNYLPNDFTINNKTVSSLNTAEKRKIPLEPNLKPQNVQPPKPHCRAHFSGTLLSDVYIEGHISKIYQPDEYGEYVGEGEYPSNKIAFPNAVAHTFDAIAVDAGTRVILYSKPNFQGRVLLDVTGPALINNVKWKSESRIKNVTSKTFSGGLQGLFPQSSRKWSSEDMNKWSNGSVKVICNGQ